MCRWYCPNRGGRVGSRRPLEPPEDQSPGAFFMSACVGGAWRGPGWGSKGRLSTHPPALPVGKGAGRCAPWSPRSFFLQGHFGCAADRSPLHCPGLGSKGRVSTLPPALPVGKGAGRCAPMWPSVGVASGLFVVVRRWSVSSSFAGGRAACRFVLRFPSFRPRTPCFCNPLMVSQEQPDYVLSSV